MILRMYFIEAGKTFYAHELNGETIDNIFDNMYDYSLDLSVRKEAQDELEAREKMNAS